MPSSSGDGSAGDSVPACDSPPSGPSTTGQTDAAGLAAQAGCGRPRGRYRATMRRHAPLALFALAMPLLAQEADVPTAAPPAPSTSLAALLEEDYDALMRRHPTWASVRGDRRFDDRLTDPSPEAEARWVEDAK